MFPERWIGRQLRASDERGIIRLKLRLQHSQPVELGEQKAHRFAYRADRIAGMQFLPRREVPLCPGEIEIVESEESTVEGGR
jgi:hypothetical protein